MIRVRMRPAIVAQPYAGPHGNMVVHWDEQRRHVDAEAVRLHQEATALPAHSRARAALLYLAAAKRAEALTLMRCSLDARARELLVRGGP